MLILNIVFCLLLLFIPVYLEEIMIKNVNNYGPYTTTLDHYGACNSPKLTNLALMTTEVNAEQVSTMNFTFLTDVKINEIKINVYNIKENKRIFMWNYKLNDPCRHYAFAMLIKHHLETTNCLVKKGNYSNQLNFKKVLHSFLGESFFYGSYMYISYISSKRGNIACFNTTIDFKKKIV